MSDLQEALRASLHIPWITQATNIFSAICIITSFLANSISLTDFIADGLHRNSEKKNWLVYLAVYLPPICAVIFYQKAFILGLSIAGTLAVLQLLILPGLIVWRLRYADKNLRQDYSVMGGKTLLILLLAISVILLCFTLLK